MKIVIAGAGEVGSHLAKLLSNEDQDIILIDEDAARLSQLDSNYNIMTLKGCPTTFEALREGGVSTADLFIAVTPYETDNIVACSMAKRLGAKTTVARTASYEYMDPKNRSMVRDMGVDRLIYPEYLAANEIITALNHSWVRHWFEIHEGQIILIGIKIHEKAPLAGMHLKDLSSTGHHFHVSAIKRNNETIIPRGDDYIRQGDIIYVTTIRDYVDELMNLSGKVNDRIRRVLIMGGSKIAVRLTNMAPDKYKFRIIDIDYKRCQALPEKCADCEIIHGDARDPELLSEVGIDDTDAFIALTDSSETNILACLSAKEHGVKKTIAEVENIQFISQAESLNIGTIINKKLLASSSIFQMLLDSDSSTSKCLALTDAEVAELEAKPGSRITHAPVCKLNLSRDVTLAGLIRDNVGMLISGNTVIQPGDHVLVFCLNGAIHKVERLFN